MVARASILIISLITINSYSAERISERELTEQEIRNAQESYQQHINKLIHPDRHRQLPPIGPAKQPSKGTVRKPQQKVKVEELPLD